MDDKGTFTCPICGKRNVSLYIHKCKQSRLDKIDKEGHPEDTLVDDLREDNIDYPKDVEDVVDGMDNTSGE